MKAESILGRSDNRSDINVLFVLDFSRTNPYQRELARALGRCGVKVSLSNGVGSFPLLGAIKTCDEPDVLHLHWTDHLMLSHSGGAWKSLVKATRFLLELLSLKAKGTRIVWTVHNLRSHERANWRIELLFNRICVRLYDQIIVHCSSAQDAVVRAYSLPWKFTKRITIVPHGSYIETYQNSINRQEARQYFGLAEQDTVFLFFGLIRPYKGALHLVSAFRELGEPGAQLLIAGSPMNEAVTNRLEDDLRADERIHARLAFIPDNDIQIYMNAADVVVLPFRDVLTSSTVILAMSFGKAIIAPRLGCIPDTLNDQGGLLYDPNREEGLPQALQEALDADLAAMGSHNAERAKRFDWDEIAQETYEVYRRCLA